MIGETLGSYRVLEKLGEGGMGTVYLAEHHMLGKRAAIKVLLPELSRNTEVVQRFFNEARAAGLLRNPAIVDVYDFGYHASGCAFIAMEFLDGESLARRLRRGPLSFDEVAVIARQVAFALGAAHARGIVHRDLKPDNVMLVADPAVPLGLRVKVLDFGIAKLAGDTGATSMTRTGTIMGTPWYMSPEQCRGAALVDARSDVYSLGCMLYEMVCGRPPFQGEGVGDILGKHQYVEAQPPRQVNPSVTPELDGLIVRTLSKRPEGRPQTMDEVARTLEGLSPATTGRHGFASTSPTVPTTLGGAAAQSVTAPPAAPRRGKGVLWMAAAAVVVAGAGGGVFVATRSATPAQPPIIIDTMPIAVADAAMPRVAVAPPPPVAPPPDPAAPTTSAPPTRTAVPSIDTVKRHLADESWARAVAAADAILAQDPDNAEARTLRERAQHETKAMATYEAFLDAVAGKDVAKIDELYRQLPAESAYREKAAPAWQKAHDTWIRQQRERVKALVERGACEPAKSAVRDVAKRFPEDRRAFDDLVGACGVKAEPPPAADATKLVADAKDAVRNGQYALGLRLAEDALKARPGDADATVVASIAACSMKDAGKARKYVPRLTGSKAVMVRQICATNGIILETQDCDPSPDAPEWSRCKNARPAPAAAAPAPVVDADADGVPDDKDYCPAERGPASRQGCPEKKTKNNQADADADGVPDDDDHCPTEPGPVNQKRAGCPIRPY